MPRRRDQTESVGSPTIPRRTFLGTLAGGLLAAPLAAEAQVQAAMPLIGFLEQPFSRRSRPTWSQPFAGALKEAGLCRGPKTSKSRSSGRMANTAGCPRSRPILWAGESPSSSRRAGPAPAQAAKRGDLVDRRSFSRASMTRSDLVSSRVSATPVATSPEWACSRRALGPKRLELLRELASECSTCRPVGQSRLSGYRILFKEPGGGSRSRHRTTDSPLQGRQP